jgi:hypothetical protein
VVDLQISPGTTDLALPAIAAQYLFPQLFVKLGIKSQARPLGSNPLHEAFSVTSCRNASRCSPGRNLKNRDMDCRSTVGSSLSRISNTRSSSRPTRRHSWRITRRCSRGSTLRQEQTRPRYTVHAPRTWVSSGIANFQLPPKLPPAQHQSRRRSESEQSSKTGTPEASRD